MSAPAKQGLDYFPFPVDFFDNEIIDGISGEFGIKGELVTVKLLCAIYRKGYFAVWSSLLQAQIARKSDCNKNLVIEIVNRLVEWEFFDKDVFNSDGILTSAEIQQTYLEATKRRKNRGEMKYLIGKKGKNASNGVNVNINPTSKGVNADINSQSKVKESKLNKSKEKEDNKEPSSSSILESISNLYQENIGPIGSLTAQSMQFAINDFTDKGTTEQEAGEIVKKAIKITALNNIHSWKYIQSILNNWQKDNLFTIANIEAHEKNRSSPKQSKNNDGLTYEPIF